MASILLIDLKSLLHWRQELAGFKCDLNSSLDNGLIGCVFQSYLKYSRYHLVEKRAANSHSFTGVRHIDQAFNAWPFLATWIIVIETHSKEEILFAYLFEVLGQEAKMIQLPGMS